MAVVSRKLAKSTVYWISFYTKERLSSGKRKQEWERVGTDKRAAEALERQRRREVADGTYAKGPRPTMPFGEWLGQWIRARSNRNAKHDRRVVERLLLPRKWLCAIPCEDLRPKHTQQLVTELKSTLVEGSGKRLGEKYVANIYALYRSCCQAARRQELMTVDPCILPPGLIKHKSKHGVRVNYEMQDVLALSSCPDDVGLILAMATTLSGMRIGEFCGRRWRDWDEHSVPLGCLDVATQYDDQPLKTEGDEGGEHPRKVPVLPALARLLTWWHESGFELNFCRKPERDDFILPRRDGRPHSRHSAYKVWRKACAATGVQNRSLHSTRHTFITMCRRGGARPDVLERVTHNAAGAMIDNYTHFDWAPLCDAVSCFRIGEEDGHVKNAVDVSVGVRAAVELPHQRLLRQTAEGKGAVRLDDGSVGAGDFGRTSGGGAEILTRIGGHGPTSRDTQEASARSCQAVAGAAQVGRPNIDSSIDRPTESLEKVRAATPGAGGHGVRPTWQMLALAGGNAGFGHDGAHQNFPQIPPHAAGDCASQETPTPADVDPVLGALAQDLQQIRTEWSAFEAIADAADLDAREAAQ